MTKAYLFFGFKIFSYSEPIKSELFDDIPVGKYYADKEICERLKEYNSFVHKKYSDCLVLEVKSELFIIIDQSKKVVDSNSKEFSNLPNTEQWQQKLDEFCDLIKIQKQKANWILTIG